MTANPSPTYDDEIDLRAIFQTLWKARTAIFIVTLAAAFVAFAVSAWLLPRKYQATAYMFVGQPVVDNLQDTGITISPILPDLKAVVQLATAPGLLKSITKDPAVVAVIGDEEVSIANMATAADAGKDQLRLQVTDTDPQRAALLANTWAEKVTAVVNAVYGLGAVTQTLDSQVLQSRKNYNQAQAELEEALPQSQATALNAQLNSKNTDLDNVLASNSRTTRVLDDLQFFEQGLNGISGETPLSLGDGLALTTLRQRSLTVTSESFTVQIDSDTFAGFTVSNALITTAQMRAALQTQLTRLQSEQSRLEQEIPQLQRVLENANAQMEAFLTKRDQTQGLYNGLLLQQQRVATILEQSSKAATVSVEAVPPQAAASPKVLVNTAVAGMLGLMLSIFGALAANWWRKA